MNRLILDELVALAGAGDDSGAGGTRGNTMAVLDLGCGVGGSMIYLRGEFDADYHGVTISGVQADLGRTIIADRGLSRITIDEGGLTEPGYWDSCRRGPFDLAFAVESFLHIPSLLERLRLPASQLKPGGRLIVVDDMISRVGAQRVVGRREQRWLREFRTGWFAHGLSGMELLAEAAEEVGLRLLEARDLTPWLELDRPRDLIARGFISLVRRLPVRPQWFNNLLGGNALQLLLKQRVLGYYYLVFSAR